MATYKKFSELPEITEANEYTKVPVLDGNEMKLLNGAKLGGDAGIKTAIIRDSGYLNAIAGVSTLAVPAPTYTYECINMTFEEAYETMASGDPLMVLGMLTATQRVSNEQGVVFLGVSSGTPYIEIRFEYTGVQLSWTADGLSIS